MKLERAEVLNPSTANPAAAQDLLVRGADIVAQTLHEIGVTTVFCYPGGAALEIFDALSRVDIRLVRTEHEQGAVFAAQGYARTSGQIGVCLATSGPGATNLVTGIADANSDSVPVLAITANVATHWLGKNAFQEVDIVGVVRPITKLARQVSEISEIAPALRDAAAYALAGRPGPVLIDFPKDITQQKIAAGQPAGSQTSSLEAGRPAGPGGINAADLDHLAELLRSAKKPVLYAGGGVIASGTAPLLQRLAERLDCPVALTMMGMGAMPDAHPLFLGPLGMHGAYCANVAVNEADLVLALGVRFDDRVIGNPAAFAAQAKIVHIDIDANEIGKNKPVHLGIHADLGQALDQLLAVAAPVDTHAWREYLAMVDRDAPLTKLPQTEQLTGAQAIAMLAERLDENAVVATGVGQHQMWAMQHLQLQRARSFLSSCGFGTMGFGLPAALGAKVAAPRATVVDIDGDGSLNMTVNELSTIRRNRLGVKVFVINNQWLGMVRQWQDWVYGGNRVTTDLTDPCAVSAEVDASPYPDFLAIAQGYRIRAERVTSAAELESALERMLADPDEPYLLDVIVERESNVYPMVPGGKTYKDTIFAPDA